MGSVDDGQNGDGHADYGDHRQQQLGEKPGFEMSHLAGEIVARGKVAHRLNDMIRLHLGYAKTKDCTVESNASHHDAANPSDPGQLACWLLC